MNNPEERDRRSQPPYIDPSLIIDTRLREIERQQSEDKADQKKHEASQRKTNWLLTIFTALLFVTSAASDILMLRYVNLTKQSADAATSAANTASDAQSQSKRSGDETRDQVDRIIAQQQRTADAMEKSLERSKAALDSSIAISQTDQRAWVTVDQMKITSEIKAGEPLVIEIILKNSGKTPARSVRMAYSIIIEERMALPTTKRDTQIEESSLGPSAQFIEHIRFNQALTRKDVDYLQDGIFTLTVTGEMTYRDVLTGTPIRKTGFCGIYRPKEFPLLSACAHGSYIE
jgi:hypothetical protein